MDFEKINEQARAAKYSNANNFDIAFWTGYYGDEDYFTWASNKAYLDMNRTMTFRDIPKDKSQSEKNRVDQNRKTWRDDGTKVIRDAFEKLADNFERWHKEVCKRLIEVYGDDKLVLREGQTRTDTSTKLTYGQAQKWLNMTLKYLWLLDRFNLIDNENDSQVVKKFQNQFHVPLDSYMLKYIAKQDKNKKSSFSSENNNGLSEKYSFEMFWDLFGSAWSLINDVEQYYKYQNQLAESITNISPLEWELVHWHKAIKYYG